jgi:uncharacterized protein YndB with AHSA1/START domain
MKKLEYKININAPAEKVWNAMLNRDTYNEWTNVSWPGSSYEGNWKQGENIRFVGPDGTGTLAHFAEVKPYKYIGAEHIAVLGKGGIEDRTSDMAKGWVGTLENYTFNEANGKTELTVEIHTNPAWEKMFNDGWPGALNKLKEIAERN